MGSNMNFCEFQIFQKFQVSKSSPSKRAGSEHRLHRELSLGKNKTLIGSSGKTSAGLPCHQSGFFTKSKNPPSSHGNPERTEDPRFPCKVYYVGRRGKPSTWLPRQKLAEERIPSAATTIENVLRKKIENLKKNLNFLTPHDETDPATFSIPKKLQST